MEQTLVLIKPDAIKRELVGEIIQKFEKRGLKILALKMGLYEKELIEEHYEVHKDKSFFKDLVSFMLSGPIVAMILEGHNAIEIVRSMLGSVENPISGTIRGDLCVGGRENLIHASDSPESATRELCLWFLSGDNK
jgi:nucleoside-diphosphate kinase